MEVSETIKRQVERLPEPLQEEVLNFEAYLLWKSEHTTVLDKRDWSMFSLTSVLRGMDEDGPIYDQRDLKEVFS